MKPFLLRFISVLFILYPLSLLADYEINRSSTTNGGGTWGSILQMDARISGSYLYITAKKRDGSSFNTAGTVYLKTGTYQTYGNNRITKSISSGTGAVSLNHNLASYTNYPKDFYVRYESSNGGNAWVGPITVDYVDTSPKVTSVSPTSVTLGQQTTFTVRGQNLSSSLSLYIPECSGMTSLSGSSSSRTFRCTPSYSAGNKSSLVKDKSGGSTLYSFNVNVVDTSPKVTSVSPTSVTLGQQTTFTVRGQNLSSSLSLYIPECSGMTSLSGSSSSRAFRCTPSYSAGNKSSLVKDKSGGSTLYSFNVNVVDTSPKVTSVSPTSATLGQQTTFTVRGQNLSSSLALYIPDCSGMTSVSGGSTSRTFRCTPSYTEGNKSSLVKASSGGTTLYSFNVNVVDTNPKVTSVSPTNVSLNQKTTFTVTGKNLPSTLQIFIPECDQLSSLGGSTTSRQFSCTPSFTAGVKASEVKDKSGGTVLHNFNVTVVDTSPKVTSLSPTDVTLGKQTTFTVTGNNLPASLVFFIPECEGMTALGGSSSSRQFSCTPSHTGGVKKSEIKDVAGGALLGSFDVKVTDTSPKVDSVTPGDAVLNEITTFTVKGSNLPDSLVLFVPECEGMSALGGDQTSREFTCTPSHTSGAKNALVKDKTGGETLYTFDVNVADLTPVVSGVSPLEATINQPATFTVTGTNLTDSIVFFIEECKDPVMLSGGSQTQRQFSCTPSFTTGTKNGVVKDKAQGNELFAFSVSVSNEDIYLNVSNWAQPAAHYLVNADIITDPANHDLRGTSIANRAELATMMYRALGGGKSNADAKFASWAGGVLPSVFFDVNDASVWYYKPVAYLSHLDFGDGTTVFDQGSGDAFNPTFRPASPISRSWALKVILESWNIKPLTIFTGIGQFDDVAFEHPAAGYIYQAKSSGLISGDGENNNYRPDQAISREELFVILHRLMEQQANLKDIQIIEPTVNSAAFIQGNGLTSSIGHRYEQPICYGVTPPQISIQQSSGATQKIDGANVYSVELTVNVSGGDESCVDSSQVTHQKNLFAAWRANGGAFTDITSSGSDVSYQKVRWIAPDQYAPANDDVDYEITVFVGDNLGTEVSEVTTITLNERTNATEEPTVTLSEVTSPVEAGNAIQLSGTAIDGGSISRSDYGIREVMADISLDGTNWERIAQNIGVDEQNSWRTEWVIPDVNQVVTLRVQARNVAGNLNSNEVTQSITVSPVLRIDGYVTDIDGNPVVNAQISLTGQESLQTISDNNGAFDFTGLQPGSYSVKATEGTVESDEQTVDIDADNPKLSVSLSLIPDSDQDGVKDDKDNCVAISNTDQANQDGDSLGDVCDEDRDGDGVNNDEDAFPDDSSKWQAAPVVNSVSPLQANMDKQTIFTIQGENLPDTLDFTLDGCTTVSKATGSTNTSVQFICTPTLTGVRDGVVKTQLNGETLKSFQVEVTDLCPQVITPAYDPTNGEEKDYPTPCDVPEGWVKGEAPDNDNDGQNDIVDSDDDNDGLPDLWEVENGLNPKDASDANQDADKDGATNKEEFEGNSDPNDSTSQPVAEYQQVSITNCSRVTSGLEVRCDVRYTTTDNNGNLAGLGVRLFYDASKLEWLGADNILLGNIFKSDIAPANDVADEDNDASTSEYLTTAWAGLQGPWPNQELPVRLFTARFKVSENVAIGETTTIRFMPAGIAEGYGFESEPKVLTVGNGCTLDIDGDNTSKPLTDGLILLRYLFGFRDEALINGALGTGATRTDSVLLGRYIDDCKTQFDVDLTDDTKPLTDGLITLRYLFGFRDDSLINGAIGSGAKRSDAESITEYLDQQR